MPKFRYENNLIEYTLSHSAKRNVNFRVKNTGEICISAPKRITKSELNKLILERADWMVKTQNKILNRKQNKIESDIKTGNIIFLNGKKYHLRVKSAENNSVQLGESVITVAIKSNYIDSQEYINRFFDSWQKEIMYATSERLVNKYLNKLNKKYKLPKPELTIRTMSSRWGSCAPTQCKITLNKNLIYPPQECLEYVVVHELAHLVEPNHSKKFYDVVSEVMPDWDKRKFVLNNF